MSSFTYGEALEQMKQGNLVCTKGGYIEYCYHVPANKYPASNNLKETMKGKFEDDLVPYQEYIAVMTKGGTVSTYMPTQQEMLTEPWYLYDNSDSLKRTENE